MPPLYKDHYPIESPGFKGLYIRDVVETVPTESIPLDHFFKCTNVWCRGNEIQTRPPLLGLNLFIPVGRSIVRIRTYQTSFIILLDNRDLYDSSSMGAPIMTAPVSTTDFNLVTIFGRAYITFHNGQTGVSGAVIKVYDGSTIRDASGDAPTTVLAAADGAAGKVEAGLHKLGFIFESDTGFYSQISPIADYTAPGSKKIDLTSVDTGPSGTVARHIVATRVMLANEEPEYFFVPGGSINDNTTTTITVDFYDSELVDSADYLFDILSEIPAGVGIGMYGSRMIVWGEAANPNIVRVSEEGEPEVFSAVDGFITTDPSDFVTNCFEQRTQLYICKDHRTEVTSDNGDAASTWDLNEVDSALGAGVNSIGGIFQANKNTAYDLTFVANKTGLYLFNGRFADTPLSWKIQGIWSDNYISSTIDGRFHELQVVVDVYKELIYVLIPHGDTSFQLLVCSYEDGLDAESVKWQYWEYLGVLPVTLVADTGAIYLGANNVDDLGTEIYQINYTGANTNQGQDKDHAGNTYNYQQVIQFPFISHEESYETHYNAIKTLIWGTGTFGVNVYKELTASVDSLGTLTVPGTMVRNKLVEFNYIAEKASIILTSVGLTGFRLFKAILYVKEHSFDIPQVLK